MKKARHTMMTTVSFKNLNLLFNKLHSSGHERLSNFKSKVHLQILTNYIVHHYQATIEVRK